MALFWVRFIAYCLLWVLLISQYSVQIPISILFFTVSLGLYFLLSVHRTSLFLYISLSLIIVFHGFVINETIYTMLLVLFITIFASTRMEKHLKLYLIVNYVLSLLLCFYQQVNLLVPAIVGIFIYFSLSTLNDLSLERKEQQELYEQLLGEYRLLKRMHVSAEREARLEERTRIARDIHDSVGHRLTALIMKLEMLAIQHDDIDYRSLKEMANDSLEETRQAVKALQTEENEGIATVVHLIRKLEAESHIVVQFTMKQGILSIPLSNEKSVGLYRIIQEALTNAMRHAESREVEIILGTSAIGEISFEVKNLIFTAKPIVFGFGLHNMKQRLEELGGNLEVFQTEKEFVVSGVIPVD